MTAIVGQNGVGRSATGSVSLTGTSYAAAKYMSVSVPPNSTASLIKVKGTIAAGAPTKLSIQVASDATGDDIIIPSTEATLATGITTATTVVAVYEVEANLFGNRTIYIHAKIDAGTVTWTEVEMSIRD